MRPLLLLCCPLLVLVIVASQARADSVLAGWGDSPTNGASDGIVFDCQSNTGASVLVVSFVPPVDITGVTGFSADLRVVWYGSDSFGAALPTYWDLAPGGCRAGALSMDVGFQGDPLVDPTPIVDPWQAGLQVTVRRPWSEDSPGTGLCGVDGLLFPGSTVDLIAGHEYYMAMFTLGHAKSASSGACAGCCWPMRLQPTVQLQTGGSTLSYTAPMGAFWNRDLHVACNSGTTPTRTSTWGALKSVYR